MQTDKSIPYPRPDYRDGDLLSKELVNGTFADAILGDLKEFRPVFDRYNVTQEKLTDISLLKGDISPTAYDISIEDVTLDRIKEIAWQPAKRVEDKPTPEIVYNPLDYYVFVEWVGINNTDIQDSVQSSNNQTYYLNILSYDDNNPGLFGFCTIKDDNGNITDVYGVFYSLVNMEATPLGRVPNGYEISDGTYIGYTHGAFIFNYSGGTYISYRLDGEVFVIGGLSDYYTPLGDDEAVAIEDANGENTHILNTRLDIVQTVEGQYCIKDEGFSTNPTKYPFGTKIDNIYFFLRDNKSSYKYKPTKSGWVVKIVKHAIWKYTKRLKYDYATDNWLQNPLKTLKFNLIRRGLFIQNHLPPHNKDDVIEFINSDMYGDFARVIGPDGGKVYYHTYDFKHWEIVTGDAATHLYGCMGRVWINGRNDGVCGLMPYTIAIKSVSDQNGGKKTIFQYSGFIFRGGR